MDSWLPQAWIASLQYQKVKPRQILDMMIAEFIKPEHTREANDEDLERQFFMTAKRMGAKIK